MTRRAWAPAALLGVGLLLNVLGLLGLYQAPRLRTDVRSPGWGGPGVGLVVRDAWPAPGEAVRLRAAAWGGLRVGVVDGRVRVAGVEVDRATGRGAWWGDEIVSRRGTSSDEVELRVPIPADAPLGVPIPVEVELSWVQATDSEPLGFVNESRAAALRVELTPADPAARWLGRARVALLPLLALAVVWRLARPLYLLAEAHFLDQTVLTALGCLSLGVAALGYWVFAWPIARSFGAPEHLDVVLAALFIALPMGRFFWLERKPR